ncbi:MAG TPA: ribonuclease P protein subunit [Methanocorpusculum sp.]|nr:ribonuclease P protein subunit [Methanocorpusculum sp.]
MVITQHTILQHELIGLYAKVVSSPNKSQENICGFIIDESKKMIYIRSIDGIKCLEKQYIVLRVTLPDGINIVMDCSKISASPVKRIKAI